MKLDASTRLKDPSEITAAAIPARKSVHIRDLVETIEAAIGLVNSTTDEAVEKQFHKIWSKAEGRDLTVEEFEKFKAFAEGYDKKLATAITALEGARHFISRLIQIEVK